MVTTQTDQSILCNSKNSRVQPKAFEKRLPVVYSAASSPSPFTSTPHFRRLLSVVQTLARTNRFPPKALATRISSSMKVVSIQPALVPGISGKLTLNGGSVADTSRPRSVCGEYCERRKESVRRLSPSKEAAAKTCARRRQNGSSFSQAQLPAMERAAATGFRGESIGGLKHNPRTARCEHPVVELYRQQLSCLRGVSTTQVRPSKLQCWSTAHPVFTPQNCVFVFAAQTFNVQMLPLFGNPSGPSRVSQTPRQRILRARVRRARDCMDWTSKKKTSQQSTDVSIPIAVTQVASSRLLQSVVRALSLLWACMTGCIAAGVLIMVCMSAVLRDMEHGS